MIGKIRTRLKIYTCLKSPFARKILERKGPSMNAVLIAVKYQPRILPVEPFCVCLSRKISRLIKAVECRMKISIKEISTGIREFEKISKSKTKISAMREPINTL